MTEIWEKLEELRGQFELYKVQWSEMVQSLSSDLAVHDLHVDGELMQQSVRFYRYANFLSEVECLYEQFKVAYEAMESQRELEIRTTAELNKEKLTEGKIKAMIVGDMELLSYRETLVMIRGLVNGVRCVRDALAQKKDMLVSLAMNLREQFRNDLSGMSI